MKKVILVVLVCLLLMSGCELNSPKISPYHTNYDSDVPDFALVMEKEYNKVLSSPVTELVYEHADHNLHEYGYIYKFSEKNYSILNTLDSFDTNSVYSIIYSTVSGAMNSYITYLLYNGWNYYNTDTQGISSFIEIDLFNNKSFMFVDKNYTFLSINFKLSSLVELVDGSFNFQDFTIEDILSDSYMQILISYSSSGDE